jgi:hypothetical protein
MTGEPDAPTETAPQEQETKPRLGRRLFVLRLAALGGATSATAACVPQQGPVVYVPQPVYSPTRVAISDSDPSDPPGRGRGGHRGSGVTDNDPSDQPGYGRGGRRVTGISDNDPSDPPGRGRGGYRTTVRPYTGINDRDPTDGPGRGRGGYRTPVYRTGLSDSDPRDAPGRGRRGY